MAEAEFGTHSCDLGVHRLAFEKSNWDPTQKFVKIQTISKTFIFVTNFGHKFGGSHWIKISASNICEKYRNVFVYGLFVSENISENI